MRFDPPVISLFVIVPCLLLFLSPAVLEAAPKPLFGLALEGMPQDMAQVEAFEQETGLTVSMVNFFLQWPQHPAAGDFPLRTAQAAERKKLLLCLTWEPMFYADGKEQTIAADAILSGRYDAYIRRFGRTLAGWTKPCLIRFAHEMNLARYHWGGTAEEYGPESPETFKTIFRYVVAKVREAGADNARWVFCPNSESLPNAAWNTIDAWYPGDAYVDVLGTDGYNWGTTQTLEANGWKSDWRSFKSIFFPAYTQLRALSADKPLYVFETSCARKGGDKSLWIAQAAGTAREWDLAGLVWFQAKKEIDWRITSGLSPRDLAHLREW